MKSVAVIGAGRWGKNLVRVFHELGALKAVVESNPELRETLAKDYPDIAFFSELNALQDTSVSAVAIATPVKTHFEIARDCLEKGYDVFVEKPITTNVAQAESLVELAKEKSRILMVGHLLLYQPAIRRMADFIKEGGLGKIYSLHQERLNLGRARNFENVLLSLGIHDIAVVLDLVGDLPIESQCVGQKALQSDIEDDFYLHLRFPNDVYAHLHTSWLWPEKKRALTIVGEKGMLVYDELAQTVTLHRKSINKQLENIDEGHQIVFEGKESPLTLELSHFLARLEDRLPPLSDGASAVEVMRVIEKTAFPVEGKWIAETSQPEVTQ